ncbi:DUF342 domain-containing protein [Salipaludibacillus keqinensis]|uniref:DUF342 domain-containing protein n=1 Tax=Salipaludibacillus keqinensis TaxID=2045207 RepID=UPI001304A879|nr:FapA family protein [Salipaludibacillus keqinensis]
MGELHDIFELDVSEDRLQAKLKQHQSFPEDLDVNQLKLFLEECGITYGLLEETVQRIIAEKVELPVVVAKGKSSVPGKDAYILSIFDQVTTKLDDGDKNDQEDVNLRKVLEIPSVSAGTIVGKKISATKEQSGMTVYGEEIPAKPGRDLKLRAGKNTRIASDETEIIATVDGQVSIEPKVIHVFPVYEVNGDLDLKVGNVDFIGNVNIRGSVPSGFEIKAKGDIRVHGTVESAKLYSDGSIFIQQGVVAQGNGRIEAKGDVQAGFLNQANIVAGGNVNVSKSILHSEVDAKGCVICKQGRGNIVGGMVSSGKGMEVNEVGNQMNTPTTLFLGISQHFVASEKKYKKELNEAQADLQKLGLLLKRLVDKEKNSSLTPKEKVMKLRIRNSLVETHNLLNRAKDQLIDLHDLFENQEEATIRVYKMVYPNADLHFGKYRRKITSPHEHVVFRMERSEIKFESL